MKPIKVEKKELLDALRTNRGLHRKIFEEAVEGFRKQAFELLELKVADIKNGRIAPVFVSVPVPVDHTTDYDRIIRMVEMDTTVGTIELEEEDFARYVMDDWDWKEQFLNTNSAYSMTARKMSKK